MIPIDSKTLRRLAVLAVAVTFGVALNPFIVKPSGVFDPFGDGILTIVAYTGLGWCFWAALRRWQQPDVADDECTDRLHAVTCDTDRTRERIGSGHGGWNRLACAALAMLALWLLLFRERLMAPTLYNDDFEYLRTATSWQSTREQLFVPFNGHLTMAARVITWLVCATVPTDAVPRALAGTTLLLFVATWPLIFLFTYREWSSALLGSLAVCLFAMTRTHQEVVLWFSAGMFLVPFQFLLISLLALQGLGPRGGSWRLGVSAACAALAPLFFSSGLLIGPISAVYLACGAERNARQLRFWVRVSVPLVSTALSAMGLSLWLGLDDHAARSLAGPMQAASYGLRVVVDVLLLENFGLGARYWPRWVYAGVFPLAAGAVVGLMGRVRQARWAFLGLALIVVSELLFVTFRTWLSYDSFRDRSRYQLFAQLGWAILVAGSVGELWPCLRGQRELTTRQAAGLVLLAALLFLVHRQRAAYVGG